MAEVTSSLNCPECTTFNAVGGRATDETLSGQCGGCGRPISKPNPHYVKPSVAVMPEPTQTVISLQNEDGSTGTITISGYATVTIDNVPNQILPEAPPEPPPTDASISSADDAPPAADGGSQVPPADAASTSNDVVPESEFAVEGLNTSGATASGEATIKPIPPKAQPPTDSDA